MNRLEFSPKQRQVLDWWRQDGFDAVICDGAVRSGKTFALGLSFFLWAMARFQRQRFGLCAASINGVRRNLLAQARPVLEGLGFKWEEKVSRNEVTLRGGGRENLFYLYGGGDEGSYAAIQGVTLAGVLLDEAAALLRGAGLRPVLRAGRKGVVFLQPGGAGALVLPGVDLQGGGKAGAVSALHHGGQPGAVRQGAGAV